MSIRYMRQVIAERGIYDGAKFLKEQGATIWAQDEASCVVYGMPQAVAKAGIASESLPLDKIAQRIMVEIGR